METQKYVYVTYINTTPEKLWKALTTPEFTRQYWVNIGIESDWKVGSPVLFRRDGVITDENVLLKCEPPRLLAYTWHNISMEDVRHEKPSRVTFEIEQVAGEAGGEKGASVKLTVTHDDFPPASKMFSKIQQGWPYVLSNLKTLLETGEVLALDWGGKCSSKH